MFLWLIEVLSPCWKSSSLNLDIYLVKRKPSFSRKSWPKQHALDFASKKKKTKLHINGAVTSERSPLVGWAGSCREKDEERRMRRAPLRPSSASSPGSNRSVGRFQSPPLLFLFKGGVQLFLPFISRQHVWGMSCTAPTSSAYWISIQRHRRSTGFLQGFGK